MSQQAGHDLTVISRVESQNKLVFCDMHGRGGDAGERKERNIISVLVTAYVLNKRLVFVVTVLKFDGPHDIRLGRGGRFY
jgi:hypothetical protein